jgi:hypothetical protein
MNLLLQRSHGSLTARRMKTQLKLHHMNTKEKRITNLPYYIQSRSHGSLTVRRMKAQPKLQQMNLKEKRIRAMGTAKA